MTRMDLKEMHERLMLYKMVRQVVEKSGKNSSCEQYDPSPWLCNVYEGGNELNNTDVLH